MTKVRCLIPFSSWDILQYVYYHFPVCHFMNFEVSLSFLIKLFFYRTISSCFSTQPGKSGQNFKIPRTKRAFKLNKKPFSSLSKDFQLLKFVSDLSGLSEKYKHVWMWLKLDLYDCWSRDVTTALSLVMVLVLV